MYGVRSTDSQYGVKRYLELKSSPGHVMQGQLIGRMHDSADLHFFSRIAQFALIY